MKEQIISFETAKLAKEKGLTDKEYSTSYYFPDGKIDLDKLMKNTINKTDNMVFYAPTQTLLQKWIREEHRIHLVIEPSVQGDELVWDCQWISTKIHNKTYKSFLPQWATTNCCDSYEQALEEGLVKTLKMIKS